MRACRCARSSARSCSPGPDANGVQYDAVTVSPHRDLGRLFKAYDVRGVVPDELDEDLARSIGAAFAEWSGVEAVAIGRDCRLSSPSLAAALSEGITSRGTDVIDIGLASTDLLYFASGSREVAGIMLTASHNPPDYNGMKFCLPGAKPVGQDTGLAEIRDLAERHGSVSRAAKGHRATGGAARRVRRARALVRRRLGDATADGGRRHRERHGWPGGPAGVRAPADDARAPVPRARRNVPEPSRRPDRSGEPARPQTRAARTPRGHRVGVRRRRRSRVPGRRTRRRGERLRGHRARRHRDARAVPGREDRLQPDLLVGRARGDPGARRRADPDAGRPLVHQAGDGRDAGPSSAASTRATTTSARTTERTRA